MSARQEKMRFQSFFFRSLDLTTNVLAALCTQEPIARQHWAYVCRIIAKIMALVLLVEPLRCASVIMDTQGTDVNHRLHHIFLHQILSKVRK